MSGPKTLIEKIKALPPDHLPEVEEFVDLVAARAQSRAAAVASTPAFERVWNNPGDDAYDA